MTNSGISRVGVITHYNYFSLMKHLSTGKEWNLSRKNSGLVLLPPFVSGYAADNSRLYTTRLEAIKSISDFILNSNEEFTVMSDSDVICNIDLKSVIKEHVSENNDITLVTKKIFIPRGLPASHTAVKTSNGRIIEIEKVATGTHGYINVITNITVMRTELLKSIVVQSIATGEKSFTDDVIKKNLNKLKINEFLFDGTYFCIDSLSAFYHANMELLNTDNQSDLFNVSGRPIYTNVHSSPPTRYTNSANIKNSLIADGCVIQGTVRDSIIFRGVKIEKGCNIENSILFENTHIGAGSNLKYIITEKNVNITEGITLSGHIKKPFFIEKNMTI
jgi:glucose-1-phosphate adenylyltransferase